MDRPSPHFRLDELVLRHGRIGRLDAIYMQYPDGEGGHRHWFVAAGDDGIAFARPTSEGPLVPGRPEANLLEIEDELARIARLPADPESILLAFGETEWEGFDLSGGLKWLEDKGMAPVRRRPPPHDLDDLKAAAMVADAFRPVASRLKPHRALLRAYAAQVHLHHRSDDDDGMDLDAFLRMLRMPKAEIEAIAAMGEFKLLRPAIDLLDVRFDRPKAEVDREVMARLGISQAAIRRIPAWLEPDGTLVRALRNFPLDWLPDEDDRKAWTAMDWTARLLGEMGASDAEFPGLVASCKGDWVGFIARCSRAAHGNDASQDYRSFSLAIMNAADVRAEFQALLLDLVDEDEGMADRIEDLGHEALTDGRSLPAILESSRIWHDRFKSPAPKSVTWPPLLPRWTHRGTGIRVVPLSSSTELDEEGAAMRHCVGGEAFALDCLRNLTRILSLRRGEERVSTAEIQLGPDSAIQGGRVEQHLGWRNGRTGPGAVEALEAYLDLPHVRELVRRPLHNVLDLPARTEEELETLLAAWRPYMAGRWRNATLDDFREALAPEDSPTPALG